MRGTIARQTIKALYEVLEWYFNNPGAGKAQSIIQYYDLWRDLHTLSVNISSKGWEAFKKLAHQTLHVNLRTRDQQWRLLFAIETYLNILMRAMALNKLGRTPSNVSDFENKINSNRNLFPPSVFEWIFQALDDQSLDTQLRNNLENTLTIMLQTIASINVAALSFDSFRVLYQNILPREIRRSLGEFYTNEQIVDEVLDAAGLNCDQIKVLYERWKTGKSVRILDPACGSGSFLVRLIRRIYSCLHCKPDIVDFIESIIYGIDINPFASEMARLNVILAISDGLQSTCRYAVYNVQRVNVYWGDSLTTAVISQHPTGARMLRIRIPSLARFLESTKSPEIILPHPDIIDPIILIDNILKSINKKSKEEFIRELLEGLPEDVKFAYGDILGSVWDVITSVINAGNSRAIELLKSSIRVLRHVGEIDYVIGNPPWVRIHEISPQVRNKLRKYYKFYLPGSSYDPRFRKTKTPFKSQQDYSMAFVERGLQLLKQGGVLSYVITSKILKTTYAGKLRETLLYKTKILRIVDYSLYPVSLFEDAVNYPLIIAVKNTDPSPDHAVNVTVYNTVGHRKDFQLPQQELPLDKNTTNLNSRMSPWILAPLPVIKVLRKLQSGGERLGDVYEIMMGVKTSANDLFIIKEIKECNKGIVRAVLENGREVEVEEWLIHPMVRGEDIDPFEYRINYYIIFPHDPETLEPIWDPIQKEILVRLGVLTTQWRVRASGSTLVYETSTKNACNSILNRISLMEKSGWRIVRNPCKLLACTRIGKGNADLRVNVEKSGSKCKVYVDGLRIPGAPKATRHFMDNLERLVKRNDYRINLPPWTIFRVSRQKFQEYRIAWQENTKFFEAAYLSVLSHTNTNICQSQASRLIVPIQTVYFISEKDRCMSLIMLAYLNSSLVRSLMKLIAWSARGGYFRHISFTVGHLPVPQLRVFTELCHNSNNIDINNQGRELLKEFETYLVKTFNITEKEYLEVVNYGKWLNEIGVEGEKLSTKHFEDTEIIVDDIEDEEL
ncbi:MAG: N-6 DNA methylase [Crenarchaeota archaeon]|nr:N-6 DNA methylase [Thermoproteota archaeon]